MEKMPNGDLVLTVPELQTAVVAVDLSPQRIASSSLSNRLRLAEQAVLDGLRSDPKAESLAANYHPTIEGQSLNEAVKTSLEFQKQTGIDSMRTIVPADEVELFEDAILNLAECNSARVAKYVSRKILTQNAPEYAYMHIRRAAELFDELFPPDN